MTTLSVYLLSLATGCLGFALTRIVIERRRRQPILDAINANIAAIQQTLESLKDTP